MPATTPALRGGELNAAISKAVVRSFSDYIGRGPTKARTSIRDDLVVCLLENSLTRPSAASSLAAASSWCSTLAARFRARCAPTSLPPSSD